MTLILNLDASEARDAAATGEKAAALARLRHADLPVPPGFVVTTTAFDEALAPIAPRITSLLADAGADATSLGTVTAEIDGLISGLDLTGLLNGDLHSAYLRLAEAADSVGNADEHPVAVRSSSTAEDLAGASFAGQYSSFLNVAGPENVLEHVRAVWTSLFTPHAIAYRNQRGIPPDAARMAVLVQTQLSPDASGVLFTRDPLSGAADRLHVNAVYGLGEGVVAGDLPSDSFVIDRSSLDVVERGIATKSTEVSFDPSGGITQVPVPEERRDLPSLSDTQLAQLGQLALDVQSLEGGHRDIEFAVAGDRLHLLQARPVTGLVEDQRTEFPVQWDTDDDVRHAWALSAGFSTPRPLQRFVQDVERHRAVQRAHVFEETGSPQARANVIRFINGYQYVRGPEVDETVVAERLRAQEARADEHAAAGTDYYVEEIEPLVRETLESLGPFRRRGSESLADRLQHLRQALDADAYAMGDLHWRMTGAGNAKASITWPPTFAALTGEPTSEAATLLQAIDHKTTRLVRRLRGMARIVQRDPQLATIFREQDFARLEHDEIEQRPAARRLRARFRALLRDYGRRSGGSFGSSVSFDAPTWNIDPSAPLALIASYATQDLDELDAHEARAHRERVNATRRIRRRLARDAAQLARFDSALLRVHNHVRSMENHNFYIEQGVVGVLREAIWWVGEALVRDGRLDQPNDALHLTLADLEAALDHPDEDLRSLISERARELDRQRQLQPPAHLGDGDPATAIGPPNAPADGSDEFGLDGRVLRGQVASRGRHTGRARVFTPGGIMPEVERGDVLVARNAGQDWAPILPLLGGIVLDQGAVFQHAALVAREYQVPCVIQTVEATSAITDHQRVTIDADSGVVHLDPLD